MYEQTRLFRHIFFVVMSLVMAGSMATSHADEIAIAGAASTTTNTTGSLNKNPVPDGTQVIRNMVKSIGPEAAMDMMFSSINPVCQKTLLSKSTDKASAPANAEEMRDNKYLQPAIAVGDLTTQWAKASPDNRNPAPVFNWIDPKNYWGWMRMGKPATEPVQKTTPPVTMPPKRY